MKKQTFLGFALLAMVNCGSTTSLDFQNVVGIQPSTGAGDTFSGEYSVIFEAMSDGCKDVDQLEAPQKGVRYPIDVTVEQKDGTVTFRDLEADLHGSISLQAKFEVGGGAILDRGDQEDNILRTIYMTGEFMDVDNFKGSGSEQLEGVIGATEVSCSFSFDITGVRK